MGNVSLPAPVLEGFVLLVLLAAPLVYYPFIQEFSELPKRLVIQSAACLTAALWLRPGSGVPALPKHPLLIALGAWLAWSGLSVFWAPNPAHGLDVWRHWACCALFLPVVAGGFRSPERLDRLVLASVAAATIVALIGIGQALLGWDFIPQGSKPGATFSNKNIAVQFVVMIWPLALMRMVAAPNTVRFWIRSLPVLAVGLYLVLAGSRAGWLAALVSLAAGAVLATSGDLWKRLDKKRLALTGLVLFLLLPGLVATQEILPRVLNHDVAGPAESQRTDQHVRAVMVMLGRVSGQGGMRIRLPLWGNTLVMIRDHPLLGLGLDGWFIEYPRYHRSLLPDPEFGDRIQPRHTHNEYLQIWAETGPLGLAAFLAVFFLMFRSIRRTLKSGRDPEASFRLVFVGMALIAFLVNAAFDFPLRMAVPPLYLMVVLGLGLALFASTGETGQFRRLDPGPGVRRVLAAVFCLAAAGLAVWNARLIESDRHVLAGSYQLSQGRWTEAEAESRQAHRFAPGRYLPLFNLGKALAESGRFPESARAYEQALVRHPNHLNSLLNLSASLLRAGRLVEARRRAEQALAIKPDYDKALLNLGSIDESLGRLDEALGAYERCVQINPGYADCLIGLGVVYIKKGEYDRALPVLERARTQPKAPASLAFHLGFVLQKLGRPDEAEREYRAAADVPALAAEAYNQIGLISSGRGSMEQAAQRYRRALALKPGLGAARVNLALALMAMGRDDEARLQALEAQKLNMPQAPRIIEELDRRRSGTPGTRG
ncbi:MAG: tetratricopeptide repeat protein [Proteobacteria bacterium]|nr:tetratricopeptide repeat protein [Pseudomonadota bacterium]